MTTRSVLVTGCSTGFGLEIALDLAEHGFQVYATMRDLTRTTRLEQEAVRRRVAVRILRLDVTEPESIEMAVRTIVAETGGIYAVVNNAGQFLRGYFEDLSNGEVRQVFATNVFGTMAVTRAVLPHMRAAKRGRILIMSSVAGKIGAPTGSAYSASRFAQEGFAESLSQELEPLGIHVVLNMVEPGITRSAGWTPGRGAAEKAHDRHSPYFLCLAAHYPRIILRALVGVGA